MKKFLILACLFFISPAFAEVSALTPQWSEFTPSDYLHAEHKETTFWNSILASSREKLATNNYWVARRKSFEDSINQCQQWSENTIKECFSNIRIQEMNKTQMYLAEEAQKENRRARILNAMQTQQMINANAMQTQQMINAINRPHTYIQNGNYIYGY